MEKNLEVHLRPMRVQLHFDVKEEDGRLWFKRYFMEDFPTLPNLYNYVEATSLLNGIEENTDIIANLDQRIYYVSQIVWLKDEQGVYPLIVCSEREDAQEG